MTKLTDDAKSGKSQTITLDQGAQPTFGRLAVGVHAVGVHEGSPITRLWLRDDDSAAPIDLRVGDSTVVEGHGTVTVLDITPGDEGRRGSVTLRFVPEPDAAPQG